MMERRLSVWIWSPSAATLGAAVLVILGFVLSGISWWFFTLVAVGAFGPGILRELGWLNDKDELQLLAARRAGYHAFLVAGFVAVVLVAYIRAVEPELKAPQELATFFLALLWLTWFFSSLMAYWGPRKTASRVLIAFGCAWGLFNIAGHLTEPIAMLMQLLVTTAPFFVLAWLAGRWPRAAGFLLLAVTISFIVFFEWYRIGPLGLVNQAVVMVLFAGPLLASGIALLVHRSSHD